MDYQFIKFNGNYYNTRFVKEVKMTEEGCSIKLANTHGSKSFTFTTDNTENTTDPTTCETLQKMFDQQIDTKTRSNNLISLLDQQIDLTKLK